MKSINKIELQGTVGVVNDTRDIVTFSLLTVETFTSSLGDAYIQNTWHNVQVNKPNITGDIKKFSEVHVLGRLTSNNYVDPQGATRSVPKIIATEVKVLD